MASANDTIRRALRLATVIGLDEAIYPQYIDSSIQALNEMLSRWEADGLDLNHTTVTALGDTLTVPDDSLEVIAYNLAVRAGVEYGAPTPDRVISYAEYLYSLALTGVISPDAVVATTTAGAAIDRAMRLCGLARAGDLNRGTYALSGLKALNDMMARWEGNGLATGYVALTATSSAIGIAEKFVEPVVFNLAVEMAPEYNKDLSPEIKARAALLYQNILQDALDIAALPTTAEGIVKRALRLIGLEAGIHARTLAGLQALNEMLLRWNTNGAISGFSAYTALANAHGLTSGQLEAAATNLAVILAAEYNKPIAEQVFAKAQTLYQQLIEDATNVTSLPTDAQGVIKQALRLAGVPKGSQTVYLTSGLQALNNLLHRWEANDIPMGFSGFATLGTAHNLPSELLRPITYNLAVDLAAENGLNLRPEVAQIAAMGYEEARYDSQLIKTVYMIPSMGQ